MPQEEKKTGATNAALTRARAARNDEFYTRRESIESELRHYRPHFKGKSVYCNCDDPDISQFSTYFYDNFSLLGLRKLVTTCYKSKNPLGWTRYKEKNGLKIVYDGKRKREEMLKSDGDFRSDECIRLLRKADIVVTNPPFSLFREYVAQLVEEDKDFLIIGNMNAVGYKDIFHLIMAGKLWLGNKPMGVDMLFNVPPHFAKWLKANKKEGSGYKIIDGVVKGRSSAIWFTNLDHKKRHEDLILSAKYKGNKSDYPKYDNYDAINVNRVADIPRDYAGVIGVPITFLDKWNPKQFEIVGIPENLDTYGLKTRAYTTQEKKNAYFAKFGKPGVYDLDAAGVLVKSGLLHKSYGRIFIKNRRLK